MTPPKLVDCPRCFSYWYKDIDEAGRPYTCYGCHNRGKVTEAYAAELNKPKQHEHATN